MDKLRDQAQRITFAIWTLSSTAYFSLYFLVPAFKHVMEASILFFGASWTLVPISIALLYEKFGWKHLNPQLDFGGIWKFEEEQFLVKSGKDVFDYEACGHMQILQNPRSIRIVSGRTFKKKADQNDKDRESDVSTWRSRSCELDADGYIYATLDHESSPARDGGSIRYGVEVFFVSKRGSRGRPINLGSTVYHCIGQGVARKVLVKYTRAV
jgi:hypothetical protein